MSMYRKIFSDAWLTVWRNKLWWLFGMCAVFFGSSIELEIFDSFFNKNSGSFFNFNSNGTLNIFNFEALAKLPSTISNLQATTVIILTLLVTVVFLAIVVLVGITGQIVLIRKTKNLSNNKNLKEANANDLKEIVVNYKEAILPASIINIVYKIIAYVVIFLISLPITLTINKPVILADLTYLFSFIILIPITITLGMMVKFSVAYIICDGLSWKNAIVSAWRLFKKNWLASSEMSLMLFLVFLFGSLLALLAAKAITIILSLLAILISPFYLMIVLQLKVLAFLLSFLIFIWAGSFITTFTIVSWTNFFLILDKKGFEPKIVRVFNNLIKK